MSRRGRKQVGGESIQVLRADPIEEPAARRGAAAWLPLLVGAVVTVAAFVVSSPAAQDESATTGPTARRPTTAAGRWAQAEIDPTATVLDVAYLGGSTFAVGSLDDQAAVWTTTFGQQWRPLSGVEAPGAAESAISRTVVWKGAVYGYGWLDANAAVWQGSAAGDWDLIDTIPPFGSAALIDVAAAGNGLLAVAHPGGGIWASNDAVHWTAIDQQDLGRLEFPTALAGRDGWFYAAGADCQRADCEPAISRSRDGIAWESVDLPAVGDGSLLDIIATGNGLIAVGTILGEAGAPEPLVVQSVDGVVWQEPDFDPGSTSGIALQHVSARGDRIVVTGVHINLEDPPVGVVAGVWSSADGGSMWDHSTVEGAGGVALTPYTPGTRVALIGAGNGQTVAWTGGWDSGATDELRYATR